MLEQYKDILSVSDAAKILCTGKNRIYALLEEGKLKGFRIGHVWKIPKQSLQDYILSQISMEKDT
ncbi:MAG: helix-turn-helix domain-containing protein [Lachnospiraceae bacterium]|nr:helix-turn-helix domain-containing protein [Lachnospiraceae bacterium]